MLSFLMVALPCCKREHPPEAPEPLPRFRALAGELKAAFEAEFEPRTITVNEPSWLEEKDRLVETENYQKWPDYFRYYVAIRVGDLEEGNKALGSVPRDERRTKYTYEYMYDVTWGELDVRKTNSLAKPYLGSLEFYVGVSRVKTRTRRGRDEKPLRFAATDDEIHADLFRFFYQDGNWEPEVHENGTPKGWRYFTKEFRRALQRVNRDEERGNRKP